jgi:predicted nucleic acid-binding protein
MARTLVDTTVLYAAANSRASRHDTALDIVRGADRGQLPSLLIPDPILIETMNGLATDVGKDIAVDFHSRLHSGSHFEIRREPLIVWNTALDTFEQIDRLSLADAILVTSARHHSIEYCYSFDGDFDGFDSFTRLITPDNPFSSG